MPNYIKMVLDRFHHLKPNISEDSPGNHIPPTFGATIQEPIPPDKSKPLSKKGITRVQQVVGCLLYYALAVDPTMLVALSDLAAAQAKSTENTNSSLQKLLNYAACHPNAKLEYRSSDMILYIDSDASYLSVSECRSRAGGYFYLSQKPTYKNEKILTPQKINGPIYVLSKILRIVVASAAESELGALFLNGQKAVSIRNTLNILGHPQPPTPMQTDNSAAFGIVNENVRRNKSRSMDMRFFWIKDRIRQKQFLVYWGPGKKNLADYFTKHFPASTHRELRTIYLSCNLVIFAKSMRAKS